MGFLNNSFFNKPRARPVRSNLTYPQAKARFPNLHPFRDADKDGLRNMNDCRPFNRKRQGEIHKTLPEKSAAHRIAERRASKEGKNYFGDGSEIETDEILYEEYNS